MPEARVDPFGRVGVEKVGGRRLAVFSPYVMAEANDCPQCGLINPPAAPQCDCGYDFAEQRATRTIERGANLTAGDWILCLVAFFIAIILGLLRLVRGNRSGIKMIGVSALVIFFAFMVALSAGFK